MNDRRRTLCRIHRDSRALEPDAETEDEPRDKEVWPGVSHALPNTGQEGECRGNEYSSTASE